VDQGTTQCALGLRTQPSKPTGQSPYFLVYGSEAILPVDVMWDSPALEQYDEGISEDRRRVDIDGLEEAQCAALVQSARYHEGIRRYHDRNVKKRSFNVGDLVLRRIQNTEGLHKLSLPWEGPFTAASRRLKAKTSTTRGISTSSVVSTPSLSSTLGAQVYTTTQRPLHCKRPPGPGTSLRTILLQDPALTATNGSWAAPSDKGL
jgi:hypothetical protein